MRPARPARQPFRLRHVVRIALAAGAAAFAGGLVVADLHRASTGGGLSRLAAMIAAVMLLVWVSEIRVARQLARNEAHLSRRLDRIEHRLDKGPGRDEYWHIYSDVMADLAGLDGETSGDITVERHR